MTKVCWAWLGLGANLGDPVQQIINARTALATLPSVSDLVCSSFYVSSPVGYSDQPNFINCVIGVKTCAPMDGFFAQMQAIEARLGRVRDPLNQNAPRVIDIDLLLFGEEKSNTALLTVPHPRIGERLFVMEPLAELGVSSVADTSICFDDQLLHRLAF